MSAKLLDQAENANAYAGQYSGLNDKSRTFVRAERGGCSND